MQIIFCLVKFVPVNLLSNAGTKVEILGHDRMNEAYNPIQ